MPNCRVRRNKVPRQKCRGLGAEVPRQKCRGWRVGCGRCKRFIGSLRIGRKCQGIGASKVPRFGVSVVAAASGSLGVCG